MKNNFKKRELIVKHKSKELQFVYIELLKYFRSKKKINLMTIKVNHFFAKQLVLNKKFGYENPNYKVRFFIPSFKIKSDFDGFEIPFLNFKRKKFYIDGDYFIKRIWFNSTHLFLELHKRSKNGKVRIFKKREITEWQSTTSIDGRVGVSDRI